MTAFLIRRLVAGVLTLFAIATLCFVISRFAPGSPITSEKQVTLEVKRNIEKHYGLDRPLHEQFLRILGGYLKGDLGPSFHYRDRSVNDLVWPAFKVSILLGGISFVIALFLGVPLGVIASARQNKLPDYLSMSVAVGGICIPNFLLGPLLVLLFAFVWPSLKQGIELWTPNPFLAGAAVAFGLAIVLMIFDRRRTARFFAIGSGLFLFLYVLPAFDPAGWPQDWTRPSELQKLVLPGFTLAFVHVAYISRLTRAGMLDVMNKDYIRTARAKGLEEKSVFLKHGLKNGITPVVSYVGPMAALIITGSIVVEKVFEIPGLGQHFVKAALNRDYGLVMGTVLIYSALVIVFNFVVDLTYGFLDPRVRLQ